MDGEMDGEIDVDAPAGRPPIRVIVVGAHLSGQPLNHQLTDLGGRLVATVQTAPCYRFFALATEPPKPGLVRTSSYRDGSTIEAELWELEPAAFGRFVDSVPSPLVIGRVQLDDGSDAAGFLCEPFAVDSAIDITRFGGWRAYLSMVEPG